MGKEGGKEEGGKEEGRKEEWREGRRERGFSVGLASCEEMGKT